MVAYLGIIHLPSFITRFVSFFQKNIFKGFVILLNVFTFRIFKYIQYIMYITFILPRVSGLNKTFTVSGEVKDFSMHSFQ